MWKIYWKEGKNRLGWTSLEGNSRSNIKRKKKDNCVNTSCSDAVTHKNGWISQTKEARYKGEHTVLFHLYEIQEENFI